MVSRDELIDFIYQTIGKELLEKALQKDERVNGVQFLGGENVEKVTLGVSINEEFLLNAVKAGSNFCIFHHGLDTETYKARYPLYSQKRLKLIFKNDLTIVGFHYALDAHAEIGNNITIIKKLGAEVGELLYEEWGYTATFEKSQDVHELAHKCQEIFDHEIFVVEGSKEKIKKIGVVSGGAKPYAENIAELEEKRVELFISGETSESSPYKMKESGIAYFVCGHCATEIFGVQELGKKIESKFKGKLSVEFIDIKNPI
jgi:dinuclear metal center YbgI/SA1388 family protein